MTVTRHAHPYVRTAYAVGRVLLGLLLIANAPVGTLIHPPPSGGPGDLLIAALWQSPFIMVLAKLVELSVGVLLVSNRLIPFALILFAPVLVNIVCFQAFYAHHFLPVGAAMSGTVLFLSWVNRAAYLPLLRGGTLDTVVAAGRGAR